MMRSWPLGGATLISGAPLTALPMAPATGADREKYCRTPVCPQIADTMVRGSGRARGPSRPGEFHPEPLTDPDLTLSRHPARAIARRLPPSIEYRVPPVAG